MNSPVSALLLNQYSYHPFGMITFGRSWEAGSEYRYGFNMEECDSEVYGDGNIYDYGFRVYNPRLCKFLSIDPLTHKYSMLTPYQFASNTPIQGIDIDGLEIYYSADGVLLGKIGTDQNIKVVDADYTATVTKYINWTNTVNTSSTDPADMEKAQKDYTWNYNMVNNPKYTHDTGMEQNELFTRVFLGVIKQAEAGMSNEPLDYNRWNGPVNFTEDSYSKNKAAYSKHPGDSPEKGVNTAAGAYQFKDYSFASFQQPDFSPASQDRAAIAYLDRIGVLGDICTGEFTIVLSSTKLLGTWVSFKHMDSAEFDKTFKEFLIQELNNQSELGVKKGETFK